MYLLSHSCFLTYCCVLVPNQSYTCSHDVINTPSFWSADETSPCLIYCIFRYGFISLSIRFIYVTLRVVLASKIMIVVPYDALKKLMGDALERHTSDSKHKNAES